DVYEQRPIFLVADRVVVAAAVEVEVHLVGAEAVLPLSLEDLLEDGVAQELRFLPARELDGFYLLVDVALFIGEKEVVVTAPADERFLLQASQARLYVPTQ